GGSWRAFEVVTSVQVLEAEGATRVWLPTPLTRDTDYFKSLGTVWSSEGGTVTYVEEPKYGVGIVSANFSGGTPILVMTSRFATRDRSVDLKKAPQTAPREDAAILRSSLQPTELIPTDGIVRETAM